MKSVKWFYVGAMAIALGMLTFATVACHDDDDDPKPAEGEVVETPKPVVEYYIMGTVTSGGAAMDGAKVKVGSKNYTTDSNGKFSVTESATGTYSIEASSNGYLSQKTSVVIANNAENRSVVTVALALTKESPKTAVSIEATGETKVEDNLTGIIRIDTAVFCKILYGNIFLIMLFCIINHHLHRFVGRNKMLRMKNVWLLFQRNFLIFCFLFLLLKK